MLIDFCADPRVVTHDLARSILWLLVIFIALEMLRRLRSHADSDARASRLTI